MYLIMMRHGIAEDIEAEHIKSDAERKLTRKGQKRVQQVAKMISRLGFEPTHILSSPRVRALETAQVVASTLSLDVRIKETATLDFSGSWAEFVQEVLELKGLNSDSIVLATGHEPCCSEFVEEATIPNYTSMPMKKGAAAIIQWPEEIEKDEGRLLAYLTPRLARQSSLFK